MVTTTTVYGFQKPAVAGDEDAWGGYLNNNIDKYESILTGNTTITSLVITTADINGGTLDNVVIGGSTPAAITGTTITGTSLVGPLATAAQTNITSLGTLTTLTVDDITINGSTISDAGSLTLDIGSDLTIDAGGGYINFFDDGTPILSFGNSSSNAVIQGRASDKDIIFKGNDGGSTITLLTLDVSEGGVALFNAGGTFNGDLNVVSGTDAKLTINDAIGEVGSGNLAFQAQNTAGSALKPMGFRAEDIRFATGSAERVRITDSGQLIVNTTSASVVGNGGFAVKPQTGNGTRVDISNNGEAMLLDGPSSGTIVAFYGSGSGVGSISTEGGYTKIIGGNGSVGSGLGFFNLAINARTASGAVADGTVSLGETSNRFKDLHLSGNMYVGHSIYHDGDTDTRIIFDTDTMYFQTGGTNRLRINGTSSDFQNQDLTGINDIYLASEIYHTGDTDTKMGFGTNNVTFTVGGTSILSVNSSHIDISGNINAVDDIFLHNAIYHAGDTDTLVSFGTDTVTLRTGGSTRLTANNNAVYIETSSLAEDYDALSGTSPSCNVHSGGAFSLTMSGNTTFSFGSGSSGYAQGFVLQLTGNGSTVTWPSTVRWAGGSAPDAPANGETDILVFFTRDGGSNWYGVLSSDAAS
jgi:hypothetical protein